ncbi:MAG: TRM11 family SAM-dependent methyltransferase [bacterium]
MVRTIHRETGKPSRDRDADVEIWVALRREGSALLIFRRLRNRSSNSDRPKGMLAPEVGALLCRYSDPSAADVFLDPFCGHGGIFLERMRWKYRLAFALDRDQGLVNALKKRLDRVSGSWRKRTYVRSGDGRTLEGFEPGFITAIVTDPPWGEYDRSLGDVDELYSVFLASSANVLAPGGRIVLLAGRAVPVSEIVKPLSSSLAIEGRDDILVSGKKATLYKLSRR